VGVKLDYERLCWLRGGIKKDNGGHCVGEMRWERPSMMVRRKKLMTRQLGKEWRGGVTRGNERFRSRGSRGDTKGGVGKEQSCYHERTGPALNRLWERGGVHDVDAFEEGYEGRLSYRHGPNPKPVGVRKKKKGGRYRRRKDHHRWGGENDWQRLGAYLYYSLLRIETDGEGSLSITSKTLGLGNREEPLRIPVEKYHDPLKMSQRGAKRVGKDVFLGGADEAGKNKSVQKSR